VVSADLGQGTKAIFCCTSYEPPSFIFSFIYLFMVFLMELSAAQTTQHHMTGQVNDEKARM
jgi:hypothetical protein